MTTTLTPAADLEAELHTLIAERDDLQRQLKDLANERNAVHKDHHAALAKLGNCPPRIPGHPESDAVQDAWIERRDAIDGPYHRSIDNLETRLTNIGRRLSELGPARSLSGLIHERLVAVRSEHQRIADLGGVNASVDLDTLRAAVRAAAAELQALRTECEVDAPQVHRNAIEEGDTKTTRAAYERMSTLPVLVELAARQHRQANLELARAELAHVTRAADDAARRLEAATAAAAEAERQRAVALGESNQIIAARSTARRVLDKLQGNA